MKAHLAVPALVAIGMLLTAACADPPVAPSSPPSVTTEPVTYIRGQVMDTFWRPVPAALVEIVGGPLGGTRRIADDNGRFDFTSTSVAESTVTLRVSKDGFETTSNTATWQRERDVRIFWARLYLADPHVGLGAGNYTLTISMDLATADRRAQFPAHIACLGFPAELASRTYDANITEASRGERFVNITGPTVDPFASVFTIWVAGDVAAVDMEWAITEEFAGNRYLNIMGGAVPKRFTVDSDTTRVPFEADFRHCELSSPVGIYNDCSQVPLDRVVRQQWCSTDRVTLTFVKR